MSIARGYGNMETSKVSSFILVVNLFVEKNMGILEKRHGFSLIPLRVCQCQIITVIVTTLLNLNNCTCGSYYVASLRLVQSYARSNLAYDL